MKLTTNDPVTGGIVEFVIDDQTGHVIVTEPKGDRIFEAVAEEANDVFNHGSYIEPWKPPLADLLLWVQAQGLGVVLHEVPNDWPDPPAGSVA